eukprot:gene31923-30988_t
MHCPRGTAKPPVRPPHDPSRVANSDRAAPGKRRCGL